MAARTSTVTIDELTLADEPGRWAGFGFRVDGDTCRLGAITLRLAGSAAGRGILGWSLRGVEPASLESPQGLDGLPTSSSPAPVGVPADEHPNGIRAVDHVVAMTPALDRSVEALTHAGLDLRRVRDEPTPAGAPRQAFFRLGEAILEVVQEPEEVLASRADGRRGPARFWGLALLAGDLERAVAAFGEHGGEIRPAVQRGRRIATIRRSAGLTVPLALMSAGEGQ